MLLSVAIVATGCHDSTSQQGVVHHPEPTNAIYHWKGSFEPTAEELAFLERHNIGRLYIRMFDVVADYDYDQDGVEAVPIATTRFKAPIPAGVEVIPVTYITLEGLKIMKDLESEYAELLVQRLLAMASYNNCGEIREVQFDCDWTATTRDSYFELCRVARELLNEKGVELSVTVRLHQLREEAPEVARGVLMLYNTGAIKSYNTRNSILDIADVEPYMHPREYALPLDYAYPAYGWGVKFRDKQFVALVSDENSEDVGEGETLRKERASAKEVLEVKALVEKTFGAPYQSNILYHLDIDELNNYTDDEIFEMFAHNEHSDTTTRN